MWRIFVPLKYLSITHPEKSKYDFWLPLFAAGVMCLPLFSSSFRSDALGSSFDLLGKLTSVLGALTGFYIAALAAVATFGRPDMDDVMPGDPPLTLPHGAGNASFDEKLSRRRFLSFLFGYMAFLALVLTLLACSYQIFDRFFIAATAPYLKQTFFVVFWVIFSFLLSNLLSNTFLGLFYFTDRIHRPEGRVTWGKQPKRDLEE